MRNLKTICAVFVFVLLAITCYFYFRYEQMHPSTDDAYLSANIIQISSQVSGKVIHTDVRNNDYVKQGQVLFQLDPREYTYALNKATAQLHSAEQDVTALQQAVLTSQANVAEKEARLTVIKKNTHRTLVLVKKKLLSLAQGDQAKSSLQVAIAALSSAKTQLQQTRANLGTPDENNSKILAAKAAVSLAKLNLQHTTIKASKDGYLVNFNLDTGSVIAANTPLFSLVDSHSWWVDANFKETDLENIKVGLPATIILDLYPRHPFKGKVQSLSYGSGSAFSVLPAENATGNWVKVTQRFPVKIMLTQVDLQQYPLRVGASAQVTVKLIP